MGGWESSKCSHPMYFHERRHRTWKLRAQWESLKLQTSATADTRKKTQKTIRNYKYLQQKAVYQLLHCSRTLVINFSNSRWIHSCNATLSNESLHFSAFCVLIFSSTMGVLRIFSMGWATMVKFHFNNSELIEQTFFYTKMNSKISNFKIQGPMAACSPSDAHELDQIQNPFSDMYVVVMSTCCCKAFNAISVYYGRSGQTFWPEGLLQCDLCDLCENRLLKCIVVQ